MQAASWFNFLKPAPIAPPINDEATIKANYRYWRIRIFYSIYIGYAFFYFTRKSFTFAIPAMSAELHFSYGQIGAISTILYITYGISKFVSGIASDRSNPRYFMATGLILTGIVNIMFGLSSSFYWLALLWGLNGWFQGWGWPPCTKLLTYWYSHSERGSWWSIASTSHNVGGALIPIIATYFAQLHGWRYAMFVPGILCIGVGFLLINRLRDTPETLGLPSVEVYNGEEKPKETQNSSQPKEERVLSAREILFKQVLTNRLVWILSISYFFVYVVRTAMNDWLVPFLAEVKGYDLVQAGVSVFWFEVGGFLGMLAAGWGSDYLFKGQRVPCIILCAIGMTLSVPALWYSTAHNILLDYFIIAAIGFFVFGPQMLVGLAVAEFVDKKAACTANGFAGWFAYIGAAFTGYPLGKIIDEASWNGLFSCLAVCSIVTFLVLLPLWVAEWRVEKKKRLELSVSSG